MGLADAAAAAFPSPLRPSDVRGATVGNPTVLMHFEDILERLPTDDPFHRPVARWVEEQRLARQPRVRELGARVEELEGRLQETEAALAALHASRSWRVTRPLRAATDGLRRLRG